MEERGCQMDIHGQSLQRHEFFTTSNYNFSSILDFIKLILKLGTKVFNNSVRKISLSVLILNAEQQSIPAGG